MERRVAVATGGAQGLGWAIGERLSEDGFEVVLVEATGSAGQGGGARRARPLREGGFLASEGAAFITGVVVDVNGGSFMR